MENIEYLIDCVLLQKNLDEVKGKMEAEKDANRGEIARRENRRKEILKELYEKAIVEDSLYNENLKEEATRIQEQKVEVEMEKVILKEMPSCKNIESVNTI